MLRTFVRSLCTLGLLLGAPLTLVAQDPGAAPRGLRVYLDCQQCDEDYLRTEIAFVDYVRDRQAADVHVLVTTLNTGAGGTEYTMHFVGQGQFADVIEDLQYVSAPNDSDDQEREGMARVLRAGFIRYAARTPLIQRMAFSLEDAEGGGGAPGGPLNDPWNAWVFEIRIGADLGREASQRETELEASVSASRVTHAWKNEIELSTDYSQDDRFVRDEWIENVQRDHEAEVLIVRSISNHWSVGGTARVDHSTFENRDLGRRIAPAIEFNFFPYAQSTRRSLTLQYSVGANRIRYLEETLYGQTAETLYDETIEAELDVRQRWGSMDAELSGSHYFHDPSKYHLEARGGIEVNLFRGFSLDIRASAQRIHDQLHLPGGDRTPEEILLEQRELATAYRYGASVGIRYSFGSIFNSVVNPRMGNDNW